MVTIDVEIHTGHYEPEHVMTGAGQGRPSPGIYTGIDQARIQDFLKGEGGGAVAYRGCRVKESKIVE